MANFGTPEEFILPADTFIANQKLILAVEQRTKISTEIQKTQKSNEIIDTTLYKTDLTFEDPLKETSTLFVLKASSDICIEQNNKIYCLDPKNIEEQKY